MADAPSNEHNSSPWSQRGFVLAAVFVGGLVLVGLVLLLVRPGGNDDDSNGQPSQNAPAPAPTRKDPNASVCGLAAGDQKVPAVPPEAQWELVGTIAAPTEPKTVGPGIKQGKRRLCFAHSPTGALFAAVNFVATVAVSEGDPKILRELTAEGAARDATIEKDATSGGSYDSSGGLQLAGFRLSSYSAAEATVDLAFAVRAEGYARLPLSMRWERGDWKIVIATSQGPFAAFEGLQNLSGYVPWSGT
ncbi:MAG: hypothetical protein ACRDPC_27510 [Solirubrobacteraceae bacterium]